MTTENQVEVEETIRPDISPYLAEAIDAHLIDAAEGHCVRVNHLTEEQSQAVIPHLLRMADARPNPLAARLLSGWRSTDSRMSIRTDEAIELRNRKSGVFCLFVPASAHNSTASSLGNSFAEINGAEVMESALTRFLQRSDTPADVRRAVASVRSIFANTTPSLRPAATDLLVFAVAAADRRQRKAESPIGLELWRVGLIPDAGADFAERLRRNRTTVAALSRPARITASSEERIDGLKLIPGSVPLVKAALAGQRLDAPKVWTKHLASDENATFDRWKFLDEDVKSDCQEIRIKPFLDEQGALITENSKGLVQSLPGAPLFAVIGEKKKLTVKWETIPTRTTVARWYVAMVPADASEDVEEFSLALPSIEVRKPTQRTASLNLNLQPFGEDDLPQEPLRVRIRAIAETGEELLDPDGQVLEALSSEFHLSKAGDSIEPVGSTQRGSTVATLPEGVLRVAATRSNVPRELNAPQHHPGTTTTRIVFRVNDRDQLSILMSSTLDELQKHVLENPTEPGIWSLLLDDVDAPPAAAFAPTLGIQEIRSDSGKRFFQARKSFFSKVLNDSAGRDRIEFANWTTSLNSAARSYANTWADWLDATHDDELQVALGVDTVRIRVGDEQAPSVDALMVLPTHPMRALWFCSQAALFTNWADALQDLDPKQRSHAIDLDMAAGVLPANVPPLLHHPDVPTSYPFFRNLDAGHGIAFSSKSENAAAQFSNVRAIFGLPRSASGGDTAQIERAAQALQRFQESHPYADPLKIALINLDDGTFIAQTLDCWEAALTQQSQQKELGQTLAGTGVSDEPSPLELPGIQLTSYGGERGSSISSALDRRRREGEERVTAVPSDHLRPSFSIVERPIQQFQVQGAGAFSHQQHLTIVQDLADPVPTHTDVTAEQAGSSGLGLHGLLVRYSSAIADNDDGLAIAYGINLDASITPHPVERTLTEATVKVHRAMNAATARLLGAESSAARAALQVKLNSADLNLIHQAHANSDWVVTIDRFIGPELFDRPDDVPHGAGRTYILDATPDFQDGVSRRSFITTSSRAEVEAILLRAMGRYGFQQLHESVGALVQTLRTVSGRLVLDALRSDSRAAEIVGIGAVVAWLKARRELVNAIIVPVDTHLDLFRASSKQAEKNLQRCDLALFRFDTMNRLKLTLIEVKSRSGELAGLDALGDIMADQMRRTGEVVVSRCAGDFRVDLALQRSALGQILSFYLGRAFRFGTLDQAAWENFTKRIANLERANLEIETDYRGFVIALDPTESSRTIRLDERTKIDVLTVADIARETTGMVAAQTAQAGVGPALESEDAPVSEPAEHPTPAELASDKAGYGLNPNDAVEPKASEVEPEWESPSPTVDQDVLLGVAVDQPVVWQPRVAGAPHLFILGIPGQGKTVTTERLLTELAALSTPAFVLDFHGTYADPNGRYARLADPAIVDAARGLPFSPFAIDPRSSQMEISHHAREIMNVVDHVFNLGEIQADLFYRALKRLYDRRGFGDVEDDQPDPEPPTLIDLGKTLERMEKDQGVRNLIARTRVLFEFDLFKPSPDNLEQFDELLKRGLVVSLNRLGGDEMPLALSGFLLRQIYLSMMRWPIAERINLVIVLDEAHRLARDVTLPKLMKEGRKYGVAVVIASQGLADFHPDVIGNAGTKISFRINYPDSQKVAKFYRIGPGQDLTKTLENLKVGQAVIQTPEMPRALITTMQFPS